MLVAWDTALLHLITCRLEAYATLSTPIQCLSRHSVFMLWSAQNSREPALQAISLCEGLFWTYLSYCLRTMKTLSWNFKFINQGCILPSVWSLLRLCTRTYNDTVNGFTVETTPLMELCFQINRNGNVSGMNSDFSPLRIMLKWKQVCQNLIM